MKINKILEQKVTNNDLKSEWSDVSEGRLSVDIFETEKELMVIATMAGALRESVSVNIENDLLTIRGRRDLPIAKEKVEKVFYNECFWGPFSRTIVLPVHVKSSLSKASFSGGILTIKIPKETRGARIPITVVEE